MILGTIGSWGVYRLFRNFEGSIQQISEIEAQKSLKDARIVWKFQGFCVLVFRLLRSDRNRSLPVPKHVTTYSKNRDASKYHFGDWFALLTMGRAHPNRNPWNQKSIKFRNYRSKFYRFVSGIFGLDGLDPWSRGRIDLRNDILTRLCSWNTS